MISQPPASCLHITHRGTLSPFPVSVTMSPWASQRPGQGITSRHILVSCFLGFNVTSAATSAAPLNTLQPHPSMSDNTELLLSLYFIYYASSIMGHPSSTRFWKSMREGTWERRISGISQKGCELSNNKKCSYCWKCLALGQLHNFFIQWLSWTIYFETRTNKVAIHVEA